MSDFEIDPTFTPDADSTEKKDIETNDEAFAPEQGEQESAPEGEAAPADTEAPTDEFAAPEADAAEPAAPEADAEAPAAEGVSEGDEGSEAEAAPVADDGNVVHPEAIQPPLAETSAIAPALPSDSTAPASGEAGDVVGAGAEAGTDKEAGEGDKSEGDDKAGPVPATPAPLDEIRAGAQSDDGEADASAGIVPQPKPEDALAQRPLSGIASDEARGAVDAMPAAAQQHMGQWVKGVHEAEPAQDGQLPTTADLPGTPIDATGVGTYSDRGLTKADEALESRAQDGDEQAKEAIKNGGGITGSDIGEGGDEADQASDAGLDDDGQDLGENEAEGLEFSDEGDDLGLDAGGADGEAEGDSDDYFGEPLVQHGPFVDVAEDGFGALKQAAEQAALAQNHFQGVPLAALDSEHKDLLVDLRITLGDLLKLAGRLFERSDR